MNEHDDIEELKKDIVEVLAAAGRPMTKDEIREAVEKLREQRKKN